MDYKMDLKILRTHNGQLIGFEVIPKSHPESEAFCATFPRSLLDGKKNGTDITLENGRLCLIYPTCPFKGECSFEVSPEDERELNDLLELQGKFAGKRLAISHVAHSLTGGFQIFQKGTAI